jgi:trehalose 6-phosphate synthase
LRIGFFNHIPFPPYEIFAQLPWRRRVLDGLLGADLLGFQRPAECACTVVSEGGIQASQSDEIRVPEWGDIEKGKVKAPRVGGRPAMRQVFKSISWRRPTRRAHEEVGTPNIS